jgi:hypothetical protein
MQIEISRSEMMRTVGRDRMTSMKHSWRDQITIAGVKQMQRLLLDKKESFYRPKLGMEEIQKLSYNLLNESGDVGDVYCFHHSFSKYQHYFVLSGSETFRNFVTEPYLMQDRDAYKFYCKLQELYPNKWVMGRSDDPYAYRVEMASMRRYDATYDDLEKIAGINDVNRGTSYKYDIKRDKK